MPLLLLSARTRKRKASNSVDESQREYGDSISELQGVAGYQRDPSDASSTIKRRSSSSAKAPRSVKRSSSLNVPELFVNRDNATGYSPQSSEHTELPAQDRFRNASFLSRSAILGDDFQGKSTLECQIHRVIET